MPTPQQELREAIAEWLKENGRSCPDSIKGDCSELSLKTFDCNVCRTSSLLTLLDSLGVVLKSKDQTTPELDWESGMQPGQSDMKTRMLKAGFVKVDSIMEG